MNCSQIFVDVRVGFLDGYCGGGIRQGESLVGLSIGETEICSRGYAETVDGDGAVDCPCFVDF